MVRTRNMIEGAICLLLLAAVAAGLLWPALGGTATPMALDSILFQAPWETARPDTLPPAGGGLLEQQATRYYPWLRYLNESARMGESLWWYPLEGCGMPFLALWETRVFSPFSLPLYFLPLPMALGWSFFLKLFAAGAAAYFLARRLRLSPPIAFFAGLGYLLGPPMLGWLPYPEADVAAWLPLMILVVTWIAGGEHRAWPLLALVIAVMGLGGSPALLAAFVLFILAYFGLRVAHGIEHPKPRRASLSLFAAILVGTLLLGIQLIPFLEYWLNRATVTGYAVDYRLTDFAKVVFSASGSPDRAGDQSALTLLHTLLPGLLLLPLWMAVRTTAEDFLRHRVERLAGVALVFALVAVVAGSLWQGLPLLGAISPQHLVFPFSFAVLLLGAAAAQSWLSLNADGVKAVLPRLVTLLPGVWVALLIVGSLLAMAAGTGGSAIGLGILVFAGASLGVLLLIVITMFRPSASLLGYGLSLLLLLASWPSTMPLLHFTPAERVFPETEMVSSLAQSGARLSGSGALQNWPLAGNDAAQVYAPSGVRLARYAAFIEHTQTDPLLLRRAGSNTLLLTKSDIQGSFAPVRPELQIEQVYPSGAILFTDLEARPRAYVTYKGRAVDEFSPDRLSAALPPLLEGASLPENGDLDYTPAQIVEPFRTTAVVVDAHPQRPGVLVLADTWYPGWTATVNGNATEIIPVDGLFRGVEVSDGPQQVVFKYTPRLYWLGVGVSLLGLALLLLGVRGPSKATR